VTDEKMAHDLVEEDSPDEIGAAIADWYRGL
jgi:hypothetical protein